MDEERIKSALEIAMEKISGLPRLTAEDIAAQKEKEYGPIGESLANRYLEGALPADQLKTEADRHEGEQGRIVRRALLRSLGGWMRIEDAPKALQALAGMALFMSDRKELAAEAEEKLRRLLDAYEREKAERAGEFEDLARKELLEKGISGSAVRPNLEQNENWRRELIRIQEAYQPRLAELREVLLQALGVS